MSRFLGCGAQIFSGNARLPGMAVVLAACFIPFVHADEPGEIIFAVPDVGRVSLGVFDGGGQLVRTLHRLAPEGDFRVGLNGYMTRWDGLDDRGRRLPRGSYDVRGYLVGEVSVSGEDFHFNDWAADNPAPAIRKILDFSLLENGDVVLLAVSGGKLLVARYSPERGFLWRRDAGQAAPHPTRPAPFFSGVSPMLAANTASVVVLGTGGYRVLSIETGEFSASGVGGGCPPTALATNDATIFAASPGGLRSIPLSKLDSGTVTFPPSVFTTLDADASRLIGASRDGVWLRQGGFEKIALPADVTSLSLGAGKSFWFVGSEPGSSRRLVGQATFTGEILRTLRAEPGGPQPDKVRASRTGEKFAVMESRGGFRRLRVMARDAGTGGGWTIEWERAWEDPARFGFVDDRLVADAGDIPQTREIKILLEENPLTGRRPKLSLRAVCDKTGSRLVAADGLVLVDVSARRDLTRLVLHRGNAPDSIRFLQGNGTLVEEFNVGGLRRIFALDAGTVDVP